MRFDKKFRVILKSERTKLNLSISSVAKNLSLDHSVLLIAESKPSTVAANDLARIMDYYGISGEKLLIINTD